MNFENSNLKIRCRLCVFGEKKSKKYILDFWFYIWYYFIKSNAAGKVFIYLIFNLNCSACICGSKGGAGWFYTVRMLFAGIFSAFDVYAFISMTVWLPEEFYPIFYMCFISFCVWIRYIYVNLGILAYSRMKMALAPAGG